MQAPSFCLNYLTKPGSYRLDQDRGSIIVLTFWASWCPDCSSDLPKKEQLYQSIDQKKVKMLTINVPARERDPLEGIRYAEKFLSQPTLVDEGRKLYDQYQCKGVPTTIIIDQTGHIYRQFGAQVSFIEIATALGDLLK